MKQNLLFAMKQNLLFTIFVVGFLGFTNAQVGIGTNTPVTTLEVAGVTRASVADGVLVPRFTAAELQVKDAAYGATQNGTLVFVTSGTGAAGLTSNITGTGFYYYDHPTLKWKSVGEGTTGIALNYTTTADTSYAVLATDDIIEYTNAAAGNFTLPSTVAVGKIYYFASTANGQISFAQVTTAGANTIFGSTGSSLIHLGGGRYASLHAY